MTTDERCFCEDELLAALARGYVGADLEAHVASCAQCRELRVVAGALLDDRSDAIAAAPAPASGTMWWRMRVRRRQEAEATARRSLLVGQAMTLAIALALVFVFFGKAMASAARAFIAAGHVSTPLLIALAAWMCVAPVAGFVAMRQK